ncbi:hypothetical protein NDU88_001731 [Pleurodeles waltl]|uniref:Uncharacterized protein n=1 Tax=Pleurodeles waltl TaxID=8319 RepID=A0AAV7TJI7_PLEWA|nr:hypothetical protein NDU88_001731 [Pleurodeles waltl]
MGCARVCLNAHSPHVVLQGLWMRALRLIQRWAFCSSLAARTPSRPRQGSTGPRGSAGKLASEGRRGAPLRTGRGALLACSVVRPPGHTFFGSPPARREGAVPVAFFFFFSLCSGQLVGRNGTRLRRGSIETRSSPL